MPQFPTWDRANKCDGESVTLSKSDVKSSRDLTLTKTTPPLACTIVETVGGDHIIVKMPAGEFHDRLNDETARAPSEADLEHIGFGPGDDADEDADED